jgi:hypothetical protein
MAWGPAAWNAAAVAPTEPLIGIARAEEPVTVLAIALRNIGQQFRRSPAYPGSILLHFRAEVKH